ncbi:TENX protein, partial [Tachuris rubrigastra]|nr:TENX protein [Tachuris rubrigastra]
ATVEPEEPLLPSEEAQPEHPQTEPPPSEALPARAVLGELRVSSITPSSVGLQWSVPEGPFDSFTLYRDAQGQPQALPMDGGSRSVTVPGLSPSQRYRFHLYGLRGGKRIDHVSTEATTATAEPEEPLLPSEEAQPEHPQTEPPPSEAPAARAVLGELRVSSVTPSSVGLQWSWSVPEGPFDSFTLQYRDAQGQPQALSMDGASRSVMVSGLSPSRRYRFHLYGLRGRKRIDHVSTEATTGDGEAPASLSEAPPTEGSPAEDHQHEHQKTEVSLARAVLGELRVSSITPSSVGLHWSVPEGPFDSFTLQYRDAQGQPQALPMDGGSRSV